MREEKHVRWVACCYQAGRGNTGLTEVVKEATKPPFPGELKGTNRAVEKKKSTKATDVFVKPLQTLIQGRWSSDFRAKAACPGYNNINRM